MFGILTKEGRGRYFCKFQTMLFSSACLLIKGLAKFSFCNFFKQKKKMDCCICSPMASIFRPPRNTICSSCFEGARCMATFLQELDIDDADINKSRNSSSKTSNSSKGLSEALKWMREFKEMEEKLREKMGFLEEFVVAFKDGIHTDIKIASFDGHVIPAHRALLVTRSEIFRTMFELDEHNKSPPTDTISLLELNHEEVHCLLEFLYSGSLPVEKLEKHAYSLLMAADKYNIPYLKKCCENQVLASLGPLNALQVLELSQTSSNQILKEKAMNVVVKHMEEIVYSDSYEAFALKNAHLSVEITREWLKGIRDKSCDSS